MHHLIALISALAGPALAAELPLEQIKLPPGFVIEVFADGVDNARQLALGDRGTVFAGSREAGNLYAIRDEDGDYRADRVYPLASGLNLPSGIAFRDGALYVGAVSTIYRLDAIEDRLADPPQPVVVTDRFPSDRHHGWKYLGFGPDGKLYVPVGAPCNICDEPGYAQIMRLNADGSGVETYALGVRNSVGFDWHPQTRELWFTDNGRDWLGDDEPPCELNHAPRAGMHFGYPYCHGGSVLDPEFGTGKSCADYVAPAQPLGAHVAPLGMKFYDGEMFPPEYRGQIFIAEHGSWNRSSKVGYRITLAVLDGNDQIADYRTFAEGWLQGQQEWGRPADLLVLPDGSMLVADDKADVIYRISYGG